MHIRQKTHFKREKITSFQRIIRWTALFLALSLTGCSARDSGKENDSTYVFETQFHSPLSGVEDFTVFGDSVYYSTFDGEFYQWTPGGEAQKMDIEPFTPAADSRILQADFQGNLYVFYRVRQADADPIANYLVKYDASGKELARENISRLTRQFMPYETAVDAEGRLYLMGSGRLLQFDEACNYVGAAETPEDEDLIWLAEDDGGHVYCCLRDTRTYRGLIREAVYDKETVVNDQSASPEDTPIASLGNAIGEFQEGNHLAAYGENRFLTSICPGTAVRKLQGIPDNIRQKRIPFNFQNDYRIPCRYCYTVRIQKVHTAKSCSDIIVQRNADISRCISQQLSLSIHKKTPTLYTQHEGLHL